MTAEPQPNIVKKTVIAIITSSSILFISLDKGKWVAKESREEVLD
jgi:hypothetical protein